jgi:hypothetical protein
VSQNSQMVVTSRLGFFRAVEIVQARPTLQRNLSSAHLRIDPLRRMLFWASCRGW